MKIEQILKQSIDLHAHIGPEIIPRKFSLPKLIAYEKNKIKGIAVKNHFFPIMAIAENPRTNKNPIIINSIVLNRYSGGFNPAIIKATAELSDRPIIVWFPTLHSKNFLKSQKWEIPKEWIAKNLQTKIKLQPAKKIKPLLILDKNKKLNPEVVVVLKEIKKHNAILATGHLSWQESLILAEYAVKEIGIKKIIITHPIYQKINMPISIQKQLAKMNCFIEHCYSMYSIDKISIKKIAAQIKEVGAQNCILSSDVGQIFSESPSEALKHFILLLEKQGITESEIIAMLIKNPGKLIK